MRNYLSNKSLYSRPAAWILALGLCLTPELATAQDAGQTAPNATVLNSPGVAGVPNPATFSVFDRVGVAGTVALQPGSPATLGPGIAGVPNPASFSPVNRPAVVGIRPLSPGLTTITAPVVRGVRPRLVDPLNRPGVATLPLGGTGLGPGIAGPVNPAGFSPSTQPGIATGPQLVSLSGTTRTNDVLAAPTVGTISDVDLTSRSPLVGRSTTGGVRAALVITNRGGSVTTESRE